MLRKLQTFQCLLPFSPLRFSRRGTNATSKHQELKFPDATVRAWIEKVPVEREAMEQLGHLTSMTDVIKHPIAAMPDLHYGKGATVGTVIPTTKAIIPSAVGVDIGCGMIAVKTSLHANDLPGNLDRARLAIEVAVPHGRTHNGRSETDAGSWRNGQQPEIVSRVWKEKLQKGFEKIVAKDSSIGYSNNINHLGTLGTGNHFIELCLDREDHLWVMLHSGSRGVGNKIGQVYIERAKKDMGNLLSNLQEQDLAYLREGTTGFDDYVEALMWAQEYAKLNREIMMSQVLSALRAVKGIPPNFTVLENAVNCHHNYVEHCEIQPMVVGGKPEMVWLTRKGATSAKQGELGIIPGSMGRHSFIVRGKGNPLSYCSCSHGAGRQYGRGEAKRRFTIEDHIKATEGISCRKDKDVLDETPLAYKDIDLVMEAQSDLVEIVQELRQVVCVKG